MGVNVIDSAINYRHQRSERAIGQALAALIASGEVQRDEVVLATKGGFLTFDGEEPPDASAYFQEKLLDPGIIRMEEVVAGCHVISPKFLENQIDASRRNIGVETLDIYYVHNPETQLSRVGREEFFRRLKAAFAALEKAVTEGKIRRYGTATWNAYRVGPPSAEALSLTDVLRLAEEVGGKDHHLRAIQLPFNLAMPEARMASTQPAGRNPAPLLQVARAHGLMVFASASLPRIAGRVSKLVSGDANGCAAGHPVCSIHAWHHLRSGGHEQSRTPTGESWHCLHRAHDARTIPRRFTRSMTLCGDQASAIQQLGNRKMELP
jgi:aryl-alcohol dehydrogenase-like predicted oxidoreductase